MIMNNKSKSVNVIIIHIHIIFIIESFSQISIVLYSCLIQYFKFEITHATGDFHQNICQVEVKEKWINLFSCF